MKNQWPIWVLVIGVVIVVLFAFNYHSGKEFVPLSEIFPEEKGEKVPDIKYEFVNATAEEASPQAALPETAKVATPAMNEVVTQPVVAKTKVASVPAANVPAAAVPAATVSENVDLNKVPFTIQVASSKTKAMAEATLQKVKSKGYPGYVAEKNLGSKGIWYRTYVGKFQTKKEADEYLLKIKKDYKDSFIITPK